MLSVLLAISATTMPVGVETVRLGPCAPDKHAACANPARSAANQGIPVGKRCHPDPTRSVGCREVLPSEARLSKNAAGSPEAVAAR
jgi:hypothetical protein